MIMRFRRGRSCLLPTLLLLGIWVVPASATDLQLAPPTAKVTPLPKQPPRSHTINIATIERLPSFSRRGVRCVPLILGVAY